MATMTDRAAVSLGVRKWLRGQYPTLAVKESWLTETVSHCLSGATSSCDTEIIQKTNEALLHQDLALVAEHGSIPRDSVTAKESFCLGEGARGMVLVQVISKIDIGVSSEAQLDVLEARRAARATAAGRSLLEQEARSAASGLGQRKKADDPDHMLGFNAAEEAVGMPVTVFPRSTLQLELSDGFTRIKALEHRRVDSLSMAHTALGCKLLLKDVKVLKGLLLMTPESVTIKGGTIASLNVDAEARMISQLRKRLGKELERQLPHELKEQSRSDVLSTGSSAQMHDHIAARALRQSEFDDSFDDFAEGEEMFAELHEHLGGFGAGTQVRGRQDADAGHSSKSGQTLGHVNREAAARGSQGGAAPDDAIILSDSE